MPCSSSIRDPFWNPTIPSNIPDLSLPVHTFYAHAQTTSLVLNASEKPIVCCAKLLQQLHQHVRPPFFGTETICDIPQLFAVTMGNQISIRDTPIKPESYITGSHTNTSTTESFLPVDISNRNYQQDKQALLVSHQEYLKLP